MNVICVKQGIKYNAEYVNRLYRMLVRNMPCEFTLCCYTDSIVGIDPKVNTMLIKSDLQQWWPKLDALDIFSKGDNILLDLDIIILNP